MLHLDVVFVGPIETGLFNLTCSVTNKLVHLDRPEIGPCVFPCNAIRVEGLYRRKAK